MKKYTVYLSTGERVCVEANYFEANYTKQKVSFFADGKVVAIFNFNIIQGFGRVDFLADKDA